MRHIVLDTECLGTYTTAPALLQIGGVFFDEDDLEVGGYEAFQCFEVGVDLTSALEAGQMVDPATLKFWLQDTEEAAQEAVLRRYRAPLQTILERHLKTGTPVDRHTLLEAFKKEEHRLNVMGPDYKPLYTALQMTTKWLRSASQPVGGIGACRIWTHKDFDIPIIRNSYLLADLKCPLGRGSLRCFRDKFENVWRDQRVPKAERVGTYHTALSDCMYEADQLKMTLKRERRQIEILEQYQDQIAEEAPTACIPSM